MVRPERECVESMFVMYRVWFSVGVAACRLASSSILFLREDLGRHPLSKAMVKRPPLKTDANLIPLTRMFICFRYK
jgi:hypothetical protein